MELFDAIWLARLADASVRAVALAVMAALLALCVRRSAAAQHALWSLVLASMLVLPWLRPLVPATHIHVTPRTARTIGMPDMRLTVRAPLPAAPAAALPQPPRTPAEWLALAWLAGSVLFATRLLIGFLLARRTLRTARTIDLRPGFRVEESTSARVPFSTGLWRPRILLPADWREWPAGKLEIVLAHEAAHVRRRDPLIAFLAALNKCVFWFHPLAWWLERRLAVLAEHAADDQALAASPDAATYARVVLEVAAQMNKHQARLIWNSTAMAGPLVARRIRRLIDQPAARRLTRAARAALTLSAALLVWAATAVDFLAVAGEQPVPMEFVFLSGVADRIPPGSITGEQAKDLENQLRLNPEDEAVRLKLLRYHFDTNQEDQRLPLIYWLIDQHPESSLHRYQVASVAPAGIHGGADPFEEAGRRWRRQLEYHPASAEVAANAARVLGANSFPVRLELFQRAQKLDPARYTLALANYYAIALGFGAGGHGGPLGDPALSAAVREALRTSTDAELVGLTAQRFLQQAAQEALTGPASVNRALLRTIGTELITRGQALDPGHQRWIELMEGVRRLPDHADPEAQAAAQRRLASQMPSRIRVGGNVQARMLVKAPEPVYPAGATVHGVVQFQAIIGKDGRIQEAKVQSGHPILIPAAEEAVKQYEYRPTTLNGVAVEVVTLIDVRL